MLISDENSSVQHRQTPLNVRQFWTEVREIFKPRNMQTRAIWRRATKGLHNHNINIFMVLISYFNKSYKVHSGKKGGPQNVPHRLEGVTFCVATPSMIFSLLSFGQDVTLCLRHLQISAFNKHISDERGGREEVWGTEMPSELKKNGYPNSSMRTTLVDVKWIRKDIQTRIRPIHSIRDAQFFASISRLIFLDLHTAMWL